MIIKDAFNDAPIIEIEVIGGAVDTKNIVSTEIVFSENKHDMATLTYSGFSASAKMGL